MISLWIVPAFFSLSVSLFHPFLLRFTNPHAAPPSTVCPERLFFSASPGRNELPHQKQSFVAVSHVSLFCVFSLLYLLSSTSFSQLSPPSPAPCGSGLPSSRLSALFVHLKSSLLGLHWAVHLLQRIGEARALLTTPTAPQRRGRPSLGAVQTLLWGFVTRRYPEAAPHSSSVLQPCVCVCVPFFLKPWPSFRVCMRALCSWRLRAVARLAGDETSPSSPWSRHTNAARSLLLSSLCLQGIR